MIALGALCLANGVLADNLSDVPVAEEGAANVHQHFVQRESVGMDERRRGFDGPTANLGYLHKD